MISVAAILFGFAEIYYSKAVGVVTIIKAIIVIIEAITTHIFPAHGMAIHVVAIGMTIAIVIVTIRAMPLIGERHVIIETAWIGTIDKVIAIVVAAIATVCFSTCWAKRTIGVVAIDSVIKVVIPIPMVM
ncbi:MAG: hypothetical protein R6X27_15075 [Candidatus Desulfacyla sp.]